MNIALLSNSLINRTLTFLLNYVLGIEIENVFLPIENHSSDEIFLEGGECIHICDSVEEAINRSDIIIASNSAVIHNLPKSKKAVLINNPWADKGKIMLSNDGFRRIDNKPLIIIMSLGKFTDQYCTEILINKILSENGAKVHQIYSTETQSILTDLSKQGLLRHSLINTREDESDVIVVSIDGTKYHNDAECVCELSRFSPDMLFVCVDRTIDSVSEINNIAGIVCNVNMTIHSPYISYDVGTGAKYPIYCGFGNNDFSIASFDRNLEAYLKKEILKSLYFPAGTVLL